MEKDKKAYVSVVDEIKRAIIAGEIKPGEKLAPEREIAENMGVSRNSVREAIKVLTMTGVISSQQGSGNYITNDFAQSIKETMNMMFALHQVDYNQVSQVRYSLETQAYLLALEHATDEQIKKLEDLVRRIDLSTDERVRANLDKEIHYTIAEASGNVLLLDILIACSDVIDTFIQDMRFRIMRTEENKNALNDAHRDLVLALREKDRKKGLGALDHHFQLINQILLKDQIL